MHVADIIDLIRKKLESFATRFQVYMADKLRDLCASFNIRKNWFAVQIRIVMYVKENYVMMKLKTQNSERAQQTILCQFSMKIANRSFVNVAQFTFWE
jgi:hypothetical protein